MAPPRDPCSQCGSTNFEESNAIWYCHNGHAQEGGQQIGEDDGDYGRIGKKNRQKAIHEKRKVFKVYRGAKGFQYFVKAWQHILWRQSHALMHRHGLPKELWAVVRELWALRLSRLAGRLSDNTGLGSSETGDRSDVSNMNSDSEQAERDDTLTGSHVSDNLTLPDTVALNYLGILLLRHPMSLSTLYKHIRREDICYVRAIRFVPQDIRAHLAPEYHLSLDTTSILTENDLQLAVYRSASTFGNAFAMELPPINWIMILLGYIRTLALPIEVYGVVKFLARVTQFEFKYSRKPDRRRGATTYPEAQLMSLVVVATKLCFPLDSDTAERSVHSVSESAALKMSWGTWLDAQKRHAHGGQTQHKQLMTERAVEVTDEEILAMPEEQLDQYMDWFQQTYAQDVKGSNLHKQILEMFPLKQIERTIEAKEEGNGQKDDLDRIRATQAGLESRSVQDASGVSGAMAQPRPGQMYQAFSSMEEMSEVARLFHEEAAQLACLDVTALLRACLRTEKKLLQNQQEVRRAEYFDGDSVDE